MKLFLPLVRDRLRLLNTWPKAIYDYNKHEYVDLPAGSIVSVDRIAINKITKVDKMVHFSVRVHADNPEYTMKKYGGRAPYGVSVRASISDLRKMEFEHVEDMP